MVSDTLSGGVVLLMGDGQLVCAQDTDEKEPGARNKVETKTEKKNMWTRFTFSHTSPASLERSAVQCDITYYFSIRPL